MKAYFIAIIAWHATMAMPNIPFMGAVKLGSPKLVAHHLATGKAPINYQDELGNSALHYAVNLDSYEITRLLLEHQALAHVRNNQDVTPLHIAVRHCNARLVRILLKYGADPNSADAQGNSPLHLTAHHAHTMCGIQIIDLLRNYGARATLCNKEQKTAQACLLERQSNLQTTFIMHKNNLATAVVIAHAQETNRIKPTYRRVHKKYITCAKTTNLRKMRTILKHPCVDINAQYGSSQRSALMHAIRSNRCSMAQLLIDAGIDTQLRDCNGLTAHDYARIYNQPALATKLQQSA